MLPMPCQCCCCPLAQTRWGCPVSAMTPTNRPPTSRQPLKSQFLTLCGSLALRRPPAAPQTKHQAPAHDAAHRLLPLPLPRTRVRLGGFLQITWTGRLPTRSPAPDLNAPSNCLDPGPRLASDHSLDDDDMAAGLSRADEPPNYDQIKSWRSIVTLVVFVLVSKCRPCVSSWSSTLL